MGCEITVAIVHWTYRLNFIHSLSRGVQGKDGWYIKKNEDLYSIRD
jgi:hypothetical protein